MATTPICGEHVKGIEFVSSGPELKGDKHPVVRIAISDLTTTKVTYKEKNYDGLLKVPHFSNYRLPTEYEWEWAALGGENFKYAGSSNHLKVAWTSLQHSGRMRSVQPTRLKRPNGYGLYDMSGNVGEYIDAKPQKGYTEFEGEYFERELNECRGGNFLIPPLALTDPLDEDDKVGGRNVFSGIRLCFSDKG